MPGNTFATEPPHAGTARGKQPTGRDLEGITQTHVTHRGSSADAVYIHYGANEHMLGARFEAKAVRALAEHDDAMRLLRFGGWSLSSPVWRAVKTPMSESTDFARALYRTFVRMTGSQTDGDQVVPREGYDPVGEPVIQSIAAVTGWVDVPSVRTRYEDDD